MDKSTKTRGRPSKMRVARDEYGNRRFFTCPRKGSPADVTGEVSIMEWGAESVRIRWSGREYAGGREVFDGFNGRDAEAFLKPCTGTREQDTTQAKNAVEIMRSGSEDWMFRFVQALVTGGKGGGRNVFRAFEDAKKRGEVVIGNPVAVVASEGQDGITVGRFFYEPPPPRPYGFPYSRERLNPNPERNRPDYDDDKTAGQRVWLLPDASSWIPRIPLDKLIANLCRPNGQTPAKATIFAFGHDRFSDEGRNALRKFGNWLFHGCPKAWEPYGIPVEVEQDLKERFEDPHFYD